MKKVLSLLFVCMCIFLIGCGSNTSQKSLTKPSGINAPEQNVAITKNDLEISNSGRYATINGSVKSLSDKTYKGIILRCVVKNKNGNVLDSLNIPISGPIKYHEEKTFTAPITVPNVEWNYSLEVTKAMYE